MFLQLSDLFVELPECSQFSEEIEIPLDMEFENILQEQCMVDTKWAL